MVKKDKKMKPNGIFEASMMKPSSRRSKWTYGSHISETEWRSCAIWNISEGSKTGPSGLVNRIVRFFPHFHFRGNWRVGFWQNRSEFVDRFWVGFFRFFHMYSISHGGRPPHPINKVALSDWGRSQSNKNNSTFLLSCFSLCPTFPTFVCCPCQQSGTLDLPADLGHTGDAHTLRGSLPGEIFDGFFASLFVN